MDEESAVKLVENAKEIEKILYNSIEKIPVLSAKLFQLFIFIM